MGLHPCGVGLNCLVNRANSDLRLAGAAKIMAWVTDDKSGRFRVACFVAVGRRSPGLRQYSRRSHGDGAIDPSSESRPETEPWNVPRPSRRSLGAAARPALAP